jgi:hypothetical protein
MIKVNMKVWDCNGKSAFLTDYLMGGQKSFFIKKIKSFCESIGIEDKYKSGKLCADDIGAGLTGELILTRKLYKGEEQNSIKEYCKKNHTGADFNKKAESELDDDLPF